MNQFFFLNVYFLVYYIPLWAETLLNFTPNYTGVCAAASIRDWETSLRHTKSLILSLDVTRKKWPLIYQWGRRLLDLSLIDAVSLFSMHQISCHHFKWHVHCVGALVHTYNLAVSVCIVALPTRPSLKSTTMGWFNGKYEPLLGDIFYHTSFRRFEEEIEKKEVGCYLQFFCIYS